MMSGGRLSRALPAAALLMGSALALLVLLTQNGEQGEYASRRTLLLQTKGKKSTHVTTLAKKSTHADAKLDAIMQKAGQLQREAYKWMKQGQLKDTSDSKISSLKRHSVLCEQYKAPGANEKEDWHFLEDQIGCDGSIPASVASAWRHDYERVGGTASPEGSFYDSTNSKTWANGAAKKWDPIESGNIVGEGHVADFGAGSSDWLNPKRWVAERKLEWQAQAALGEQNAAASTPGMPEGYAAPGGASTPLADWADGGYVDWGRFMNAVSERYDNPTGDKYMDKMYKRLRADRAGGMEDLDNAVQKLDREAAIAGDVLERANSIPMPEAERFHRKEDD